MSTRPPTPPRTAAPARPPARTRTRALVLAIAAAATVAAAQPAAGPPPARVVVDEARLQTLIDQRLVTGEIVSTRGALLASEVEGLVIEIDHDEGDLIEAGERVAALDDHLARIDVRRAEAAVRSARAVTAQREAEAALVERELARLESARELGSANESQLDAARTRVLTVKAQREDARAMVLAAQADLDRAERTLDDMTIEAPFTGRVLRKQAEVGEWLSPGDGLVELISLERLEARVEVPESLLPFLDRGEDAVTLDIPGLGPDRLTRGTVIGELPAADPLSRLFTVRVRVGRTDDRLRPRMSLTARVPTSQQRERLTIHNDAIRRDDAGAFVYVARPIGARGGEAESGGPSHVADAVRIDPLFAIGERAAIRAGALEPGALVLTIGNERTTPGQPLIIVGRERDRSEDRGGPSPDAADDGVAGDNGTAGDG